MKIPITIIAVLSILFSFQNFAYSQNINPTLKTSIAKKNQSDSVDLNILVIKLLRWHNTDKNSDFEPLLKNSTDTVYTEIDWQIHKKRFVDLAKTNFFSKAFLDNYQKIALHLDKELKQNKIKYIVGDLPPYEHSNEWCNCQDFPSNFWTRLKIVALKIDNNSATFKWTWGNNFFYSVKAKKENNVWKIAELEKFNIENFIW